MQELRQTTRDGIENAPVTPQELPVYRGSVFDDKALDCWFLAVDAAGAVRPTSPTATVLDGLVYVSLPSARGFTPENAELLATAILKAARGDKTSGPLKARLPAKMVYDTTAFDAWMGRINEMAARLQTPSRVTRIGELAAEWREAFDNGMTPEAAFAEEFAGP